MLGRFDPFAELSRLQDDMFRLANPRRERHAANFQPSVDIWEDQSGIVVRADLPGVKPEDVQITVENSLLTLSGERKLENAEAHDGYHRVESVYGQFTRTFALPNTVNPDAIEATLDHGVLQLRLPKRAEAQPRKIEVQVGAAKPVQIAAKA